MRPQDAAAVQADRQRARDLVPAFRQVRSQEDRLKLVVDLVQMVTRNAQARTNGANHALVFLDPAEGGQECTHWLNWYLASMQFADREVRTQLRQCRDAKDSEGAATWEARLKDVQRCTELASHYLLKTDWFEGASLNQYSHLSNKLSKLLDNDTHRAALEGVARHVGEREWAHLPPKALSEVNLLFNAFSKLGMPRAGGAIAHLAGVAAAHPPTTRHPGAVGQLNAIGAGMCFNVLGTHGGGPGCAAFANQLGERIARDAALVREFNAQDISSALNAASKLMNVPACAQRMEKVITVLARRVHEDAALCRQFNAQDFATSVNALSKLPEDRDARHAAHQLLHRLNFEPSKPLLNSLEGRHLCMSLSSLVPWVEDQDLAKPCVATVKLLASRLKSDKVLGTLNLHDMASGLGALAHWKQLPESADAARAMIGQMARHPDGNWRSRTEPRTFAQAMNAVRQWSGSPDAGLRADCEKATNALCRALEAQPELVNEFKPQDVSNVMNAAARFPASEDCGQLVRRIAGLLHREPALVSDEEFGEHALANTLSALARFRDDEDCMQAGQAIAEVIVERRDKLLDPSAVPAQGIAAMANALSRWSAHPSWQSDGRCQDALRAVVESMGLGGRRWEEFDTDGRVMMANATSRLYLGAEADAATQEMARRQMGSLLALVHTMKELETAEPSQIGTLLKAAHQMQMHPQMRPLCSAATKRVGECIRETGLKDHDLEMLSNVCAGLLPIARSPELEGRRHNRRKAAVQVLGDLQPIVEARVDAFLKAGAGKAPGARRAGEAESARRPGLSLHHVVKTYAVVSNMWRKPLVDGDFDKVRARQDELRAWLLSTVERSADVIEGDLQDMGQNTISQVLAGKNLSDALDLRLERDQQKILAKSPPVKFDLAEARRKMAGPMRPVQPGMGDPRYRLIDMQGRRVAIEDPAEPVYSFYSHLTGQPVTEVKLEGEPTPHLLARTVNFEGDDYRFDVAAGSHAKMASKTLEDTLSNAKGSHGKLYALRLSDTAPGTPTHDLLRKVAPTVEDYSRLQRALFEIVPAKNAIFGEMRIRMHEDMQPTPAKPHPFRMQMPDGRPIALCPNDGCGFMKYEMAMKIPAFRKMVAAWKAQEGNSATQEQRRLLASMKSEPCTIASQALLHVERDEEAIEEHRQLMAEHVKNMPEEPTLVEQFRTTVNGAYRGSKGFAVPSADDDLHVPAQLAGAFDDKGGDVLLGKPPYDKLNLLPIEEARVRTPAKGDATAEFLSSKCFALQYSYEGFDDRSNPDDPHMLHNKGMLIVPFPEFSHFFGEADLVCSTEDMKAHTTWGETGERDRRAFDGVDMPVTGNLRVKDLMTPGSLIAMPIRELRKRDMDTDGDNAYLYAGYPKLTAAITAQSARLAARRGHARSFKPPKTSKSAYRDGKYRVGRGNELVTFRRGEKLMRKASTTNMRHLCQSRPVRDQIAKAMMMGTYDGVDRGLRNAIRDLSRRPSLSPSDLEPLIAQAKNAIGHAIQPEARLVATMLCQELVFWKDQLRVTSSVKETLEPVPEFERSSDPLMQQARLISEERARKARVTPAVSKRFPELAQAHDEATSTPARLAAILDNYPASRFPYAQYPDRPCYVEGDPDVTVIDLATAQIKAGTDALKTDSGVDLFSSISALYEQAERKSPDRIKTFPMQKSQAARELREGTFDPGRTLALLRRIPNMAAATEEISILAQQEGGRMPPTLTPSARASLAASDADYRQAARQLHAQATEVKGTMTRKLEDTAARHGGRIVGLDECVKSVGSLEAKLRNLVGRKDFSLDDAVAEVNDSLRFSIVFPQDKVTEGHGDVLKDLVAEGAPCLGLRNYFTRPTQAFRAYTATVSRPDGKLAEIQFHTLESFAFKQAHHDDYKKISALNMAGEFEKARALADSLAALARKEIPSPPACDDIEDVIRPAAAARRRTDARSAARASGAAAAPRKAYPPQVRRIRADASALHGRLRDFAVRTAAASGGRLHNVRHLDAEVLKSERSIAQKLQRIQAMVPGIGLDEAAGQVRDGLRYPHVFESQHFVAGFEWTLEAYRQEGHEVMRVANGFTREGSTYAGVNVKMRTKERQYFELQFHSPASQDAKNRSHKTYEKWRKLGIGAALLDDGTGDTEDPISHEMARLEGAMRRIAAAVAHPPGIESIKTFSSY